jgi:hypothetical protein
MICFSTSPDCRMNNLLLPRRRDDRGSIGFATSGGICTDLDAMQSVGIGGGFIMNVIGVYAPMQLTPTPC